MVFGGLPGTGKTSVARAFARRSGATYLRIDTVEQAIRHAGAPVGILGYAIGQDLAVDNLVLGQVVVADGVNPVAASRQGWRETAARAGASLLEVELVCSDAAEHRRRVEGRRGDIAGLRLPTWQDVMALRFEPWHDDHLVIDTARRTVDEAVALIEAAITASDRGTTR